MEIYVIRHTHVVVGKDTCYGQSDVELAATFNEEAAQYKSQLPIDIDAVYCSPLLRCTELAKSLNFGNVQTESALLEMNFGTWEGQKWNDIDQTELNHWMADFVNVKTPNGENLQQLSERINQFMDKLRMRDHEKVLLVTHAGAIRCIWAYILNIPLDNIFKLPVDYEEILQFKLGKNKNFDAIKRTK